MKNKGCCVSAIRCPDSDSILVTISGNRKSVCACVVSILAALLRNGFDRFELAALCTAAAAYAEDRFD